jgi:hypothetical protein
VKRGLPRQLALMAGAALLALAPEIAAEECHRQGESGAVRAASCVPEVAPTSALELAAALGPTLTFGDAANPQYQSSQGRIGALLALTIAYRSSYLLEPSLEVGYGALADGEVILPEGPWGSGGVLEQRLGAWFVSPGVAVQLWRFRPRVGLGLAVVHQTNEYLGQDHGSSQASALSQFALGFAVLSNEVLRLDADARVVLARGADVNFVSIGVSAHFDVVTFGKP